MQPTLVVVRDFGPHAIGDVIVAPDIVAQILASDHAEHVVKVTPRQTEA
jgi:hypothetical protein